MARTQSKLTITVARPHIALNHVLLWCSLNVGLNHVSREQTVCSSPQGPCVMLRQKQGECGKLRHELLGTTRACGFFIFAQVSDESNDGIRGGRLKWRYQFLV